MSDFDKIMISLFFLVTWVFIGLLGSMVDEIPNREEVLKMRIDHLENGGK